MRALLKVRPPAPVSGTFLMAQDAELRQQLEDKGVVRLNDIPPCCSDNRLRIWQGDITRLCVDAQFEKSGFDRKRIFAVQGDYAYLQCAKGCHDRLYYNGSLVKEMLSVTENCRIPSGLVPHCPVCGGRMEVHVRKDRYFVQDSGWPCKETMSHLCA